MSLHGIDISGYDEGIDAADIAGDFVIVKATEGLQGTVYNPAYRDMADAALRSGKLLGFYHYANGDDPTAEADSFMEAVADYRGRAVLTLDWEGQGNRKFDTGDDVAWCKRFLDRIRERWGCTPVLYVSRTESNAYDWAEVARRYPLWGAEYANYNSVYGYDDAPWQSSGTWGAWGADPLIHQYTSTLVLDGWGRELDGNLMHGTRETWAALCGDSPTELRGWAQSLDECRDAADYAYCTCAVYSCGYSQQDRENISVERLKDGTAETDCSAGVSWWLHMGGLLDELYWFWTAIEIDYLTSKGFALLPATAAPRRNDVLWRSGHTALYIGDGMQAEALRSEHGTIDGEPGDQDGGETVVREYPAGGWTYILRPPAKEIMEEDEMACIYRPNDDPSQPMCYYDGTESHPIKDGEELEAAREMYRKTYSREIPMFGLGTKENNRGSKFHDLIRRKL